MSLTALQTRLREKVTQTLHEIGIDDINVRTKRVVFEDEAQPEELQLIIAFKVENDAFELWLYPDEASVLEPDGEWYSFSDEEPLSEEALVEAVVDYLDDLFEAP